MRFHFEPNHTVIQSIKNKRTGHVNRFVVCKFDDKGQLETEDDKIIFILQNKLHGCTWDEGKTVEAIEVLDVLSDEDIRELAKDKGIKSWHVKKIDKLKKELGV
jgi:hypothetical protein